MRGKEGERERERERERDKCSLESHTIQSVKDLNILRQPKTTTTTTTTKNTGKIFHNTAETSPVSERTKASLVTEVTPDSTTAQV